VARYIKQRYIVSERQRDGWEAGRWGPAEEISEAELVHMLNSTQSRPEQGMGILSRGHYFYIGKPHRNLRLKKIE
jgi:hypothetical protein